MQTDFQRQPGPDIRAAKAAEAARLSSLAMRSKAHWGYSAEFLEACRAELTYCETQIESLKYEFWVCEVDGEIVGFYALELLTCDEAELEALFVEPDMIGRGIGNRLMGHAKCRAAALGIREIVIRSDPNAESFYENAGGIREGQWKSTSIPDRFLPVLRITL